VPENTFVGETARRYDALEMQLTNPAPIDPAVELLASLAVDSAALEFAIGTGRIALPLASRGVAVCGIEISHDMVAELRAKPGGDAESIPVVIGEMATADCGRRVSLVYLVYNTITNLLDQSEQVACFANAARHLQTGGHFVVECFVPQVRRIPSGTNVVPFDVGERHLGFDRYDLVAQRLVSHHYFFESGATRRSESHHRYVWPAELDLMASMAGMVLTDRWADWERSPFTGESASHVSVWRKLG
jgi:SAM-dependent methyltransferase